MDVSVNLKTLFFSLNVGQIVSCEEPDLANLGAVYFDF